MGVGRGPARRCRPAPFLHGPCRRPIPDPQDINLLPFTVIRKWLPAHLRSRNPGPETCLDLQIETDQGPRDMRVLCGDAEDVKYLMAQLRQTVEVGLHHGPRPMRAAGGRMGHAHTMVAGSA